MFDDSEPVTDSSEFFGRERPVHELHSRISLGRPTAVFGLRKIGKSSLLRRVQLLLGDSAATLNATAVLQCNASRIRGGRWWLVLEEVVEQWARWINSRAQAVGSKITVTPARLRTLRLKGELSDQKVGTAFQRDFEHLAGAMAALAKQTDIGAWKFVVFFDEVDSLAPTDPAAGYWREDYFSLWDTLQTLKRGQDDPGIVVYVLGGVNPLVAEAGALLGRPNPLFETGILYLPPLPYEESRSLMLGLGGRSGLAFKEDALEEIFRITGGHPWLLRKLGSKIHLAFPDRGDQRQVTSEDVKRIFRREKRSFYSHVDWILNHLRNVAPHEYRLLRDIAMGGKDKYLSDWADDEFREVFADHLAKYGLLTFEGDVPEISVGLIREALTQPSASVFAEQKAQLREVIDQLETAIRNRLALDIPIGRSADECLDAILGSIPSGNSNRSRSTAQLRELGQQVGLRPILDELNWGDYVCVLEKHADAVRWAGRVLPGNERVDLLRVVFRQVQTVRHNNDRELKEIIDAGGYSSFYGRIQAALEMFVL